MNDKELQNAITMITAMEHKNRTSFPKWRLGQNLFNSLNMVYPELAEGLRATDVDPFYIDERYGTCWEHIVNVLKDGHDE